MAGAIPTRSPFGDYLEARPVLVCGWCHLNDPPHNEEDVQRELALARAYSVAWRWRWSRRPYLDAEDDGIAT